MSNIKVFDKLRGGINFPTIFQHENACEQPDNFVFQKKYYDIIKEKGFNHIRFPVGFYKYVIDGDENYTLKPEFLPTLAKAVDLALEAGLMIVLDAHPHNMSDKEGFIKVWTQVAEYFKDYPEELMFELANEPCYKGNDDYLNEVQLATVAAIRKSNPTRGIALAVNQWNGTWKMLATEWSENDDNCFLSVHNYYMMEFTHQGVNWGEGPGRPGKIPFKTYYANQIKEHLEFCSDFQKLYGKKVWISECGVYLGDVINEEVAKFTEHLTKWCATYNLPYAYWEFNQGFGLYSMKEERWKDELMPKMTLNW